MSDSLRIEENLFQQLRIHEPELQELIKEHGVLTEHERGSYIIKEGSYIKVLKIVISGKVRVYQTQNAREILIYYLKPMETCTLSLSACFEDCQSNVNAIVEEPSIVLNIPVRFVRDWCKMYASWNDFTIRIFRESYAILLNKYAQLAFQPLRERVADYLHEKKALQNSMVLEMSHQQIANELGTTREVVSRLLKKMEKEGQVALGQKSITILH